MQQVSQSNPLQLCLTSHGVVCEGEDLRRLPGRSAPLKAVVNHSMRGTHGELERQQLPAAERFSWMTDL